MPGRRHQEAGGRRLARFLMTPSNRLPHKHRSHTHKVINTTIHNWTELAVKSERRFCSPQSREVVRGGRAHVWFGSGRATSAQQAHDLSAVHAHRQLALYYL